MDLKEVDFKFTVLLKQEQNIGYEALALFPGLNEVSFQSRAFSGYSECVTSCKNLLEDIMRDVNAHAGEPKFKLAAEVNPIHTGTQTMSKDWVDSEIARFWLFDKDMEKTRGIQAVGRGSIFSIPKQRLASTLN